jgi:hypothetical protein
VPLADPSAPGLALALVPQRQRHLQAWFTFYLPSKTRMQVHQHACQRYA